MNTKDDNSENSIAVSELTHKLKICLERTFPGLWVHGEISGLKIYPNGHSYFRVKDEKANIDCSWFRSAERMKAMQLRDGDQVEFFAMASFYPPHGRTQLIVSELRPRGKGSLQQQFEQLKEKLKEEGLFDPGAKKELPALPRTIGLITSPMGAAVRDFLNVLLRRFPQAHVRIIPCPVQGEQAARKIARAIHIANIYQLADVLILTRGGGSMEDLWCFNEEIVARTIAASEIPVISAIGHEIDFTISDFVADLRAPTPSAAAELVVQQQIQIKQQFNLLKRRLESGLNREIQMRKHRLIDIKGRLRYQDPMRQLQNRQQQINFISDRLQNLLKQQLRHQLLQLKHIKEKLSSLSPLQQIAPLKGQLQYLRHQQAHALRTSLQHKKMQLNSLREQLELLNPETILSRGYAIVRDSQGKALHSPQEAPQGTYIEIQLAQGELSATVSPPRQKKE